MDLIRAKFPFSSSTKSPRANLPFSVTWGDKLLKSGASRKSRPWCYSFDFTGTLKKDFVGWLSILCSRAGKSGRILLSGWSWWKLAIFISFNPNSWKRKDFGLKLSSFLFCKEKKKEKDREIPCDYFGCKKSVHLAINFDPKGGGSQVNWMKETCLQASNVGCYSTSFV